jgi:hypothetical protein
MSELRTNLLSDLAGTGPATLHKQSAAKAWVRLNSATVVQASFNISSVTDHGTGDYSAALMTTFSVLGAMKSDALSAGFRTVSLYNIRVGPGVLAALIGTHNTNPPTPVDDGVSMLAYGDLA